MFKSPVPKILCVCLFTIGLTGCGDNPADTEVPEPPEMPELQSYQPDMSYFENSDAAGKSIQNGTGFEMASQVMQGTVNGLFSSTTMYFPFFSQAQSTEPSYSDGVFEWSYSYSPAQTTQSAEVRLTAEPNADAGEVDWALFITTSGQEGPDFDNYKFMDGTSATDGSQGNWSIYPFSSEDSSPIITFQWTREDETTYTASYDIDLQQTSTSFSIDYSENGPEHTLEMTSSDGELNLVVFWNTDTGEGYVDPAERERICWNSSRENVPCQ